MHCLPQSVEKIWGHVNCVTGVLCAAAYSVVQWHDKRLDCNLPHSSALATCRRIFFFINYPKHIYAYMCMYVCRESKVRLYVACAVLRGAWHALFKYAHKLHRLRYTYVRASWKETNSWKRSLFTTRARLAACAEISKRSSIFLISLPSHTLFPKIAAVLARRAEHCLALLLQCFLYRLVFLVVVFGFLLLMEFIAFPVCGALCAHRTHVCVCVCLLLHLCIFMRGLWCLL